MFVADIEKAFDSVKHNFVFATLKKFGFGDSFIEWVRTFFNSSQSCVMNNGKSTEYFSLKRGTRQGDPLSPYLFNLALETLFVSIRSDRGIRGFRAQNIEIKLTVHADDTTFLVRDAQSLRRILKIMKKFEVFLSLKINVEKCEAGWIGKAKNCVTKIISCKWRSVTQSTIKILGVHFSYGKKLADKENFCKPIINGRALLKLWNQHWLSLAGKIRVFKALIISKPVYIATMQHVPNNALNDLHNLHQEFIWGGKRPKRKHCTLIGEYGGGGGETQRHRN